MASDGCCPRRSRGIAVLDSIRVLALLGSPRRGGNTDLLADYVLKGAQESGAVTQKIYLDDWTIRPIGEVCDNTREREDQRGDDDFRRVLDAFLEADLIVLATPVYWAGVSAQMKCFIDRLSSYFRRKPYADHFAGKSYLVVTAFGREDPDHGTWVTEPLKLCVEVLGGRYLGDLSVSAYEKGRVADMQDVLTSAYELGKQAAAELSDT
jgi:multimeric flavodoxin WrbA